jgi:ketosteroid isomerase-like protein
VKKQPIIRLIIIIFTVAVVAEAEANLASNIGIIRDRIEAWRKAWESKDMDRYMSFYSPNFASKNFNYAEWKKQKDKSFQTSGDISVQITDLWVLNERNYASVSFLQYYKGPTQSDAGIKSMVLKRTGGNWLIISEIWEPLQNLSYSLKSNSSAVDSKGENEKSDKFELISKQDMSGQNVAGVKVKRIHYRSRSDQEQVVIELSKHSIPESLSIEGDNPRYIIDVRDVFSWDGQNKFIINGNYIQQIRTYLNDAEHKLRIVLDLYPDNNYQINRRYDLQRNIYTVEVEAVN